MISMEELSVDDAADRLATFVKTAGAREKTALSPLHGALLGGGLGVGGGLLATAMSPKKDKSYLRNALLGGAMGAGVGGFGSYLANNAGGPTLADSQKELADYQARHQEPSNFQRLWDKSFGGSPTPTANPGKPADPLAGISDPHERSLAQNVLDMGGNVPSKPAPNSLMARADNLAGQLADEPSPTATVGGAVAGGLAGRSLGGNLAHRTINLESAALDDIGQGNLTNYSKGSNAAVREAEAIRAAGTSGRISPSNRAALSRDILRHDPHIGARRRAVGKGLGTVFGSAVGGFAGSMLGDNLSPRPSTSNLGFGAGNPAPHPTGTADYPLETLPYGRFPTGNPDAPFTNNPKYQNYFRGQ